jgi:hypothetical protein
MTIRRGYFRGFTAAEQTGTLRSLAAGTTRWDSNPSRKNEIECCVDRLNTPPKADIVRVSNRPPNYLPTITLRDSAANSLHFVWAISLLISGLISVA